MQKKLITIVVPVLNEELNIFPFYEALLPVIKQCEQRYDFEILFTDNHSTDSTFEILAKLSQLDNRVRVLRFSRNFGYQKSILTGYLNATGHAAVQLDCDLQDPPELLVEFLERWEAGNAVVYGIRLNTQDRLLTYLARKLFYRMINYLSEYHLPIDAGDFRLIDRKVIEELRKLDNAQPYLRGSIALIGFQQCGIPYDRIERKRGKSNFQLKDMMKLAIDGILNHSIVPLRLASFFGITISVLTVLLSIAYFLARTVFNFGWPPGFTTLAILTLIGISMNALFLGVIGEYIGRIYQQLKKCPVVIEYVLGGVGSLSESGGRTNAEVLNTGSTIT